MWHHHHHHGDTTLPKWSSPSHDVFNQYFYMALKGGFKGGNGPWQEDLFPVPLGSKTQTISLYIDMTVGKTRKFTSAVHSVTLATMQNILSIDFFVFRGSLSGYLCWGWLITVQFGIIGNPSFSSGTKHFMNIQANHDIRLNIHEMLEIVTQLLSLLSSTPSQTINSNNSAVFNVFLKDPRLLSWTSAKLQAWGSVCNEAEPEP